MNNELEQSRFLTIALAARQRGFVWVTPINDKTPCLANYNRYCLSKTASELRLLANDYPNAEVGIVIKRGKTDYFVWDIDKTGVLERMEQETGQKLPATYVVQTRPQTEPHKQHVFFLQTPYLLEHWKKTAYCGDYDILCGGGSHVVAEGQIRSDTNEVRTGNGLPIAPVPDWLVDWWVDVDVPRLREKIRREQAAKRAAVEHCLQTNSPIPKSLRHDFLRGVAYHLVRCRMMRKDVFRELCNQCERFCEDGVAMVKSKEGHRRIHAIAYDRKLSAADPVRSLPGKKLMKRIGEVKLGKKRIPIRVSEKSLRVEKVRNFPDEILTKDAYTALGLDSTKRGDQSKLRRAMTDGGFVCVGGQQGRHLWRRQSSVSSQGTYVGEFSQFGQETIGRGVN